MKPSSESFPIATRGTVKPSPATTLRFGLARILSCFVLAIVFSLLVAPGESQAHGIHGLLDVNVSTAATDGSTNADSLGDSEVSASSCVTCCASSGCVAISISETFDLDAGELKSSFQAAATAAVYQMALYGLRRPPRQNS